MKKLLVLTAVTTATLWGAFSNADEFEINAPGAAKHSILYSGDYDYELNSKQYEAEHLVQYIYKYAGGYTLRPTLVFWTNYEKGDDYKGYKAQIKNEYIQLRWTTPKFWDILGFKTNVEERYLVPTDSGAQLAGSYGSLSNRLTMEREFSSHFNLTVIPKVGLYFQRNGHAIHRDNDGKEPRNSLFRLGLEVLPQWKFSDVFTLTYDVDVGGNYQGNGIKGEKNVLVKADLYQELELMYTFASLSNLGVGAIVVNDNLTFGNHDEMRPFKSDYLWVGLRVQKMFDL